MLTLFMLSMAVATLSLTLTKTHLFAWWRDWVYYRTDSDFWDKFFKCPFCVGHWIALGFLLLYPALHMPSVTEFVVTWLAISGSAGLLAGLIYRSLP